MSTTGSGSTGTGGGGSGSAGPRRPLRAPSRPDPALVQLDELREDNARALAAHDTRLKGHDTRIGDIEAHGAEVDDRISALLDVSRGNTQRLNHVDERLDGHDTHLGTVDRRIEGLIEVGTRNSERLNGHDTHLGTIDDRIAGLVTAGEGFDDRLADVEDDVAELQQAHSFNKVAFGCVLALGILLDLLFFVNWGEYRSKEAPGLANQLTHHMHVGNFLAVLLVTIGAAVALGHFMRPPVETEEAEAPNGRGGRLGRMLQGIRTRLRRRRSTTPPTATTPDPVPTPAPPVPPGTP